VDLALAQIAALGATVAIVAGMDPHGRGSYWISLGFTFLGAAIFALARSRRGPHPPGSVYRHRLRRRIRYCDSSDEQSLPGRPST